MAELREVVLEFDDYTAMSYDDASDFLLREAESFTKQHPAASGCEWRVGDVWCCRVGWDEVRHTMQYHYYIVLREQKLAACTDQEVQVRVLKGTLGPTAPISANH